MLNLALSAIKSTLEGIEVDANPLIEKYGGLVFPITIPQEVGRTDGGESVLKEKTFPVSCGVTFADCVNNRRYQELVPNSKYRSISYWEQTGDATMDTSLARNAHKGGLLVYDIPARLVFWGDIRKINVNDNGSDDCTVVAPVSLAIQKALNRRGGFPITGYENARVDLSFLGQERKDVGSVFGKYTYGKEVSNFMLYPYDFFSLRYNVRLWVSRSCLDVFTMEVVADPCPKQ